MKTRAIFAVAVALTASLAIAPVASAASAGTTPVGSTITAKAWERGGLDDFSYGGLSGDIRPAGGFEEYVYRIHNGGASVDVQGTSGYEGLTDAEQTQWYVDAGYAPYDFTWMAFMCLRDFDVDSDAPLVDEGINLTEMLYTAADVMFPSADRDFWSDYVPNLSNPLRGGTLFGLDDFDLTKASVTGYTSTVAGQGGFVFDELAFSVSYPEFACPAGSDLEMFPIVDSANPNDYATDRALTITNTLVVDAYSNNREIASDGVFIGVTGVPLFRDFNAALWGMTQVDGKLATTGAEANGLGLLGVGLAAVGVAALVLRRARQDSL
jgi:LPXTG-motif cell wall-anchored protein